LISLKFLHVGCAALTIASFLLRSFWMVVESPLLYHRLTRILPHLVDTVLFFTGVAMIYLAYGVAFQTQAWLLAKLGAIAVYIILGMIALGRGRSRRTRVAAMYSAFMVLAYIVLVAKTRSPIPYLA
jgi:uncharacterized membrane protein SirB2